MKHLVILLALTAILYIGEDTGTMIAGTRVELENNGWSFTSDIRTYINEMNNNAFVPNRVTYSTEFGYARLFWTHECYHSVDSMGLGIGNRDYITVRLN